MNAFLRLPLIITLLLPVIIVQPVYASDGCENSFDGNSVVCGSEKVACIGNKFLDWFYITRISDGKKLSNSGEKLSLNACKQLIRASGSKVVCTGDEFLNWFYVTRISDGKKLFGDFTEKFSLNVCQQLTRASGSKVVCTGDEFLNWFYVTRISDGKKLSNSGEKLSLNACRQLTKASGSKVVCTGNEFLDLFYATIISDGKQFGGRLSLENCLQLTTSHRL
jgi:hypothetical protein